MMVVVLLLMLLQVAAGFVVAGWLVGIGVVARACRGLKVVSGALAS